MHALEIIIRRNAEAAGREAGHAVNDNNIAHAQAILEAVDADVDLPEIKAYFRARAEG